jgi:hypothetical protein
VTAPERSTSAVRRCGHGPTSQTSRWPRRSGSRSESLTTEVSRSGPIQCAEVLRPASEDNAPMRAKGMNLEKIRRIAVRCRTSYVAHRNSRYRIGSRAHEASHQRTTPRREANLAKDARQGQAEFNRGAGSLVPSSSIRRRRNIPSAALGTGIGATSRRDRMRTRISAPSSTCISSAHAQASRHERHLGDEPSLVAGACSLPCPRPGPVTRRRDESPRTP